MEYREKSKIVGIYRGKFVCPGCESQEMLFSKDGVPNNFCGRCGQKLDWFNKDNEPIYKLKL